MNVSSILLPNSLELSIQDDVARAEISGHPTTQEVMDAIHENATSLPNNYIREDDGFYMLKSNTVYPTVHPDLSTQPSVLPQRYGTYDLKEVVIPLGTNPSNGRNISTNIVPNNAIIIEASIYSDKQQIAAHCSNNGTQWKVMPFEPTEVTSQSEWWALVRFVSMESRQF